MSAQDSDNTLQTHRRWLVLGFSLGLTTVTLYFVFRGIDTGIFAQLLTRQDRGLLAAAVFFLLLQIALGGERWRAIFSALMRGRPPSMLTVQGVYYSRGFSSTACRWELSGAMSPVSCWRENLRFRSASWCCRC